MGKEEVFDFGFTAVTEEELDVVQKAHKTEASAQNTQEKIDRLYNAIQPLLNNLKADSSKEYIFWPKRMEKVEQFETYLQNIYKS
jgi:glycerol-3-phosphate dehydrogenase